MMPCDQCVSFNLLCLYCCSRQAGHRIGEHLERIVPLVVYFCKMDDDELREYCIQAFESFVRRCPKEITPHIGTVSGIVVMCFRFNVLNGRGIVGKVLDSGVGFEFDTHSWFDFEAYYPNLPQYTQL